MRRRLLVSRNDEVFPKARFRYLIIKFQLNLSYNYNHIIHEYSPLFMAFAAIEDMFTYLNYATANLIETP